MALRYRHDGLTPAKKARVYEALAKYGTVKDACRAAGISDTTFYRHEKKDPEFRSLCAAARSKAGTPIAILAWERGVTGIEEPVFHYGKVVGTRRRRSDGVFKMILMASDPETYGRQGAVLRAKVEKELRPVIEAEVRAEIAALEAQAAAEVGSLFDRLAERVAEMELEELEEAEAERKRACGGG